MKTVENISLSDVVTTKELAKLLDVSERVVWHLSQSIKTIDPIDRNIKSRKTGLRFHVRKVLNKIENNRVTLTSSQLKKGTSHKPVDIAKIKESLSVLSDRNPISFIRQYKLWKLLGMSNHTDNRLIYCLNVRYQFPLAFQSCDLQKSAKIFKLKEIQEWLKNYQPERLINAEQKVETSTKKPVKESNSSCGQINIFGEVESNEVKQKVHEAKHEVPVYVVEVNPAPIPEIKPVPLPKQRTFWQWLKELFS